MLAFFLLYNLILRECLFYTLSNCHTPKFGLVGLAGVRSGVHEEPQSCKGLHVPRFAPLPGPARQVQPCPRQPPSLSGWACLAAKGPEHRFLAAPLQRWTLPQGDTGAGLARGKIAMTPTPESTFQP